ncbi:MAG TPA: MlaA family lipoprotein [Xanthomonadaceae bacterium]|nr:MlaA family lipoprotein [Xanthomonadaceae bacterium]
MLVALVAIGIAPVWAQQPVPSSAGGPQASSAPTTESQPVSPAQSSEPATQTQQQAADDAQLPAYLQNNGLAADRATYDPWEHYNRHIYRFNKRVDTALAKPLATAYVRDVPEPVRDGVSNFYTNLREPITAVNLFLQGHPASACKSLGRLAVNTTIGIGGIFDPATRMHIPSYDEDFGQTLGRWGWRRSRYFLLPFLGPGTLRDRLGSLADAPLGPIQYFQPVQLRFAVIGLEVVDVRAGILPLDELGTGIDDDYILVREAWSQRRMHQIDDQDIDR